MSVRSDLQVKFKDKDFRHAYVGARIKKDIAFQIRALRKKMRWSQKDLARRVGMEQSRISVLENPSYEKGYQTETLRRIAEVFDVALVVRFGPFRELLDWADQLAPSNFSIPSFDEDVQDTSATTNVQEKIQGELATESDWATEIPRVLESTIEDNLGMSHAA